MMAPEQLVTYWGRGSGYSHKIDVWAIGVIMYQMLTGMFIFTIDRGTKRSEAMRALYDKLLEGTWTWPNDIEISIQCFQFLNTTMQHEPLLRPNWQEMQEHPFFTSQQTDTIKFDIIFDEEPPEGVKFENNKIFVNTKDPTLYERFHDAAIEKFMAENEEVFEDEMNKMVVGTKSQELLFPRLSADITETSKAVTYPEIKIVENPDDDDNLNRINMLEKHSRSL